MARTRQTARAIRGSRQQGEPSFVYDTVQSELFSKLLKANCKEFSSEKPTSLQSRLAQYNNCTKLAQLWILEDMMKSERENDQTIVGVEWLKQLPSELKVEIISFIPTTSKQPSMYCILQYYRVGGGDLTNVPLVEYIDTWFMSFMKYRALSKTFKSAMEHLIFKTLSNKGLDITGFISRGFTSIERRVWFVSSLIESHNRFIQGAWNGDFHLSDGFHLERTEPSTHHFGRSFATEPSPTNSNDHFSNNIDLSSVDLNSIHSVEEELLSKNEFTNETPFDSVPYCNESEMVDLVDGQSLKMLMLCNKLDHIDMPFPNGPTKNCKNETIKSLSISLLDCSTVHKIFELLPNIEDLTIILYNSMEWYQALDSLQLKSRENLKSLDIIALDHMIWTDMVRLLPTSITTIFTFLQDGPLLQYGNLEMYLDGKLIPQIDDNTDYPDPAQKLCFKSCDFSFFLQIAHKYTLLPFLSDSFFSRVGKFTSLEDLKCFTNFISKNYPIEDCSLENIPTNSLKELSLRQYLIYIANNYHNSRVMSPMNNLPHLLYYGLDLTSIIPKLRFPNVKVATTLLDHLKYIRQQNALYKIDISNLKASFIHHTRSILWREQALKILFFACENLTEIEKLEFFGDLKISRYTFNIIQLMMTLNIGDYVFKSIIKHVPRQSLLGKSTSIDGKTTFFCTLQVAMESKLSNELILQLIEKEPTLAFQVDSENLTPLHYACKYDNRWDLIPHLEKIVGTKCWYMLDSNGESPLHYAKIATSKLFLHLFPYGPTNTLE